MHRLRLFYICAIVIAMNVPVSGSQYCRPRPLSEDGDVRIAGIIQIHSSKKGKCSVLSDNEFQIAVALKWTVDILNGGNDSTQSFIPGVKIGYDIYDDCGLETLSSRRVSDILNTVHQEECLASNRSEINTPMLGLVGTTISSTTTTVSRLLQGTSIPMVGTSATLSELSNKTLYPNFIRPVPSDTRQAKVMVEIAERLKWNYIVGIHTSDNYGTEGFKEFRHLASDRGICISETFVINIQYSNTTADLTTNLRRLLFKVALTVDESIGVVYFGQVDEGTEIFTIIKESASKWQNIGNANRIHWLMSDGVGTGVPVVSAHAWLSSLLVTVSPADIRLDEIKNFFVDLISRYDDTTLSPEWRTLAVDFIQTYLKCDPFSAGSNLSKCDFSNSRLDIGTYFFPNTYVSSAIDSVFILALTLKNAHKKLCNGVPGLCDRLRSELKQNLLKTSYKPSQISYQEQGRQFVPRKFFEDGRVLVEVSNGDYEVQGEALYDINIAKNGNFEKVGYFKEEKLEMDGFASKWPAPTKSWCKDVCTECLEAKEKQFHYIPGDVLILGLFPVHGPGDRYSCGEFRNTDTSFIALLSFVSSLKDLKAKTGINFGGIVLDDCYNPLRAVHILNGFFSGSWTLFDKASGTTVDPSKVIAIVGAQSSSIALNVLPSLTELGIPLISYSATSSDLDDQINYPYFLRTVPSDTQQSIAIYKIVKLLKASHVNAIHVNNNYGRKGIAKFINFAESNGICVEDSIELSERDLNKNRLTDIIFSFRKNQARYVIFFGLSSIAIDLLDSLDIDKDPLIFIASETWGRNVKVIQNGRDIKARGSITLSVQTSHVASNNFKLYLESLTSDTDFPKTWFHSFWKSAFQCNVLGGFENIYSKTCLSGQKLNPKTIEMYTNNQRVVQTINVVMASGLGYKATIGDTCSRVSNCPKPDPRYLVSNIRSVITDNDKGMSFRIFDENGNGKTGFMVNNIQKVPGGYGYVQVGKFEDGNLDVQTDGMQFYGEVGNVITVPESPCRYKPSCSRVCSDAVSPVTEPNDDDGDGKPAQSPIVTESSEDGYVAAVVVLSIIIIILFIFLGMLIFLILRHGGIVNFGRPPPKRQRRDIDIPFPTSGGDTFNPHLSCYDSPDRCSSNIAPHSSSSHPSTSVTSSSNHQTTSGGVPTSSSGRESDLEEQPSNPNHIKVCVPATYLSLSPISTDVISVISGGPQVMYHKTPDHQPRSPMSPASHLVNSQNPREQHPIVSPGYLNAVHTNEPATLERIRVQNRRSSVPNDILQSPSHPEHPKLNSGVNPYLHPVHLSGDEVPQLTSRPRTISEPPGAPPVSLPQQASPRNFSPTPIHYPQQSAIIFQNAQEIPLNSFPQNAQEIPLNGSPQNAQEIPLNGFPQNAQEIPLNGFPQNAQRSRLVDNPETDTIQRERSRNVGSMPPVRPDYKRTTSYITGEELNPFPSTCGPNHTHEMEV